MSRLSRRRHILTLLPLAPVYSRSLRLRHADRVTCVLRASNVTITRSRLRSTFTSFTPEIFFRTGRNLRTHSSHSSPSVAISIVSRIS